MATTIKLSVETRDRIKALGGDTYEDTIIEALDALEEQQFWSQAEASAAAQRRLPADVRAGIQAGRDAIDRAFDGVR